MQKKSNIFTLGSHDIQGINKTFTMCVWNVHKCLSKELSTDIERLFHEFDIILMQEAVFSEKWNQIWKSILHFEWGFFRSFSLGKNTETGVLTGSKFRQKILDIIPTVDKEPLLRTPKASGLSLIDIEGRFEKLLIVNTHAMNFNFGKPFLRQIETVYETIKNHEWPLIWAGDFNTWSKKRFTLLGSIAKELWLEWVIPENDKRFLKLDHILYRGVIPRYAEVRHDVRTSDHYPLFAEFEIV